MLSCKDITEKADDYLDHRLPLANRVALQLHLFVCVNCRRYLHQLKLTIGVLHQLKDTSVCDDEQVNSTLRRIKKNASPEP